MCVVQKGVACCLITWSIYPLRLRACPSKHSVENQPALALACSLWEVEPARGKDWDMEAIQIFVRLVNHVTLQLLLISYKTEDNITKCQVRKDTTDKLIIVHLFVYCTP